MFLTQLKSLIFYAVLIPFSLQAQDLYVVDDVGGIYIVNLEQCQLTELVQVNAFKDISFSNDGNLIGAVNSSIYLIDTISGDNLTEIHRFSLNGLIGLTTSWEGIYYTVNAAAEVAAYDPVTETEDSIFTFSNISGGGDLSFRYGILYYVGSANQIRSYDLENNIDLGPINFEGISGAILGLSTNVSNCESKTYACAFNGGDEGTTTIFELDFYTHEATEVCTIGIPVFGSAFKNESIASLDSLDLSNNCDSPSSNGWSEDELPITFYPNPVVDVIYLSAKSDNVIISSLSGVKQQIEYSENSLQIDVSNLVSGMYILTIGNRSMKFVKR